VLAERKTDRFEWLSSGAVAFPRMLTAIGLARESVQLEMYIFEPGGVGDDFLRELVAAAERGVRVQVLVDALGSDLTDAYWRPLRQAGGEVRTFNPMRSVRLLVRDHRKLLVCDGFTGFVGGFNIGADYDGDGIETGWRDLGMMIEGPGVAVLAELFAGQFTGANERRPLTARWRRRLGGGWAAERPGWRMLPVAPGRGPSPVTEWLLRDLATVREVILVTPYFLPPLEIRRALRRAARRGARVRLVLPAVTDVQVARRAARRLYAAMLRAGVEIWEYSPRVLHAKVWLLDGQVYVGSSNLDPRSLHLNFEIMLRVNDPGLVAAAHADVTDMLGRSVKVDRRGWSRSRGFLEKLREWAAYWLLFRIDPWVTGRVFRGGG
jgi:cardiolipin synthase